MDTHTDTIKRKNPRHQGDLGVAAAIAHFAGRGWRIALPLGESQAWDLIVEDREHPGPQRVQVKTTTSRDPRGQFVVVICTRGGNQSWNRIAKYFDPAAVEWLFVLTDDRAEYLIPAVNITARTSLTLGPWMDVFRVTPPEQLRLLP